MTTPDPLMRRQRLLGLLLLGVALMLLATAATWFGSDDAGVGIASLVIGVVVGGAGVVLYRRSAAR